MKFNCKSILILGFLSSNLTANEYTSPLENVDVFNSELSTLSIQNLSAEKVEVELYGEDFVLSPESGLKFECSSYKNIELQFKYNDHEYFEVPCQSQVVISELFMNQYAQGE